MKLEFFDLFSKKIAEHKIQYISVQWEPSCSMRTDRQTRRSHNPLFAIV